MLETVLTDGFAAMGLEIDSRAIENFRTYYEHLTETNKVMNLTAISGEDESARLHFLDSVFPLAFLDFNGATVVDVGTGAGFPGLPMKIACPDIKLTLLDSLNKRVGFLRECCEKMNIDAECVHARAEECGERREKYDYCVSRAVARLNVLCELCLPYVRVGGAFVALKGPAADLELQEADAAIRKLGGSLEAVHSYEIDGTDLEHKMIVIRKKAKTPPRYPRRFALIKSEPL